MFAIMDHLEAHRAANPEPEDEEPVAEDNNTESNDSDAEDDSEE
jgi:hypothetical protein